MAKTKDNLFTMQEMMDTIKELKEEIKQLKEINTASQLSEEEWKKIIDALMEDFPEDAIQSTSASDTKKGYDTTGIKVQYLIDRLNQVVGGEWVPDYKPLISNVTEKPKYKNNVCTGTYLWYEVGFEVGVTVYGVRRFDFGGHSSMNYIDACKGALSSGLKRAFAKFSLGHKVYTGELAPETSTNAMMGSMMPIGGSMMGGAMGMGGMPPTQQQTTPQQPSSMMSGQQPSTSPTPAIMSGNPNQASTPVMIGGQSTNGQ